MSSTRSVLRDATVTPLTLALTVLLEPIARGSLANAHAAIVARRADDPVAEAVRHALS